MNMDELRAAYTVAYRIIVRERAARDRAYAASLETHAAQMADMDKLLEVVDSMKDALKEYIGNDVEQATLLDVAQKGKYV